MRFTSYLFSMFFSFPFATPTIEKKPGRTTYSNIVIE